MLNRVTTLRDYWHWRLLIMARVLLKIDTFKVTNALIVCSESHLHLADLAETQISFLQVLLYLHFLVRKIEIKFFESYSCATISLVLCCCPPSNHNFSLVSECELLLNFFDISLWWYFVIACLRFNTLVIIESP